MRFASKASRAVPMSVPLKADAVGPCRLTFGYLSVAGADEVTRTPADNALFFGTAEGSLGRVTFEDLDAIRASRGEVAPYDDGHDFSSWVYNVLDSTWLAERHAYEWRTTRLRCWRPTSTTSSASMMSSWKPSHRASGSTPVPASDPFTVGTDHPGSTLPMVNVVDQGEAHGLSWQVRFTEVDQQTLVANSELCSQRLFEFALSLDGKDCVCASALVRTRDGVEQAHISPAPGPVSSPWGGSCRNLRTSPRGGTSTATASPEDGLTGR